MPRATASDETERRDLTTCEGGYAVLRRLTYGERLHLSDLGGKLVTDGKDSQHVETDNLRSSHYAFSKAIIEHNLEDDAGKELNFRNMADVARLDSRIGGELDTWIAEMNAPPTEDARKSLGDASAESDTA